MDRKIRKLLASVKENGYIYILYHLPDKDWDYSNFGKEQYLRTGQLPPYLYDFEIISFKERPNKIIHKAHPYNNQDHKHRVGYICARKINKKS